MRVPQSAPLEYHSVPLLYFRYIVRLSSAKAKLYRVMVISMNGVVYLTDSDGRATRSFHPNLVEEVILMKNEAVIVRFSEEEPDLYAFFDTQNKMNTDAERARSNPPEATLMYFVELLLFFNPSIKVMDEKDLTEPVKPKLKKNKTKLGKHGDSLLLSGLGSMAKKPPPKHEHQEPEDELPIEADVAPEDSQPEQLNSVPEQVAAATGTESTFRAEESVVPSRKTSLQSSQAISGAKNTALLKSCTKKSAGGALITHQVTPSSKLDALASTPFVFIRWLDHVTANVASAAAHADSHQLMTVGPTGNATLWSGDKAAATISLKGLSQIAAVRLPPVDRRTAYNTKLTLPTGTVQFTFVDEGDGEPSGTFQYFVDVCKTFSSRIAVDIEEATPAEQPIDKKPVAATSSTLQRVEELRAALARAEDDLETVEEQIALENESIQREPKPLSEVQLHNLALLIMRACEAATEPRRPVH